LRKVTLRVLASASVKGHRVSNTKQPFAIFHSSNHKLLPVTYTVDNKSKSMTLCSCYTFFTFLHFV